MTKFGLFVRENWLWIAVGLLIVGWFGWTKVWNGAGREVPVLEVVDGIDPEIVKVVHALAAACKESTGSDEDFLRLGMTYQANGLDDLAIRTYTEYLKTKPKAIKPRYLRALTFLKRGDVASAAEDFSACKDLKSTFAPVYWRLALLRSDEGKYDEALELLRTSELHAPRDLTIPLVRAKVLLAKSDLEDALRQIEQADFSDHPNENYARFLRGTILRQQGRLDEAQLYLDEQATKPNWTDSWSSDLQQFEVGITSERIHASSLYRRNLWDACIPIFEKIIASGHGDHRDLGMLASSYLRKGDLAKALQYASQAVTVSPRDYNSWMNLGNMQLLASTRMGVEYLGSALNSVSRASEIRPDRWEPYDARGQILQVQGRRTEALEAYKTAVSRTRSIELCEWRLIYLLLEMGRVSEALDRLATISSDHHDNPYYLFAMSVAALQLDNWRESEKYLVKLRSVEVKDTNLQRKIQSLEEELRRKNAMASPSSP